MIAQLLWRNPGISRVEIARHLKLYRSTVSNIINMLIDKGIVVEIQEGSSLPQGGRKPICLGLNEKFGCVAGIEIQPSGYHCVVLNIANTVVFSMSGEVPELPFPEIVDHILCNLYPEIERIQLPLLAVCIGMPGIIDSKNGIIIESFPFSLRNYSLVHEFSRKYHIPFFIENDANCLAWKELAQMRENSLRHFVCINVEADPFFYQYGKSCGMGVGIGVAIDGTIYPGNKNAAGEFIGFSWDPVIVGEVKHIPPSIERLDADRRLFAEFIIELFSSFVSVVAVLNPEMIFAYGELARNSAEVQQIIYECVPQFNAILERTACGFGFRDSSMFSVATGAALMYFLHLFSTTGYTIDRIDSVADWDAVFALSQGKTTLQCV